MGFVLICIGVCSGVIRAGTIKKLHWSMHTISSPQSFIIGHTSKVLNVYINNALMH